MTEKQIHGEGNPEADRKYRKRLKDQMAKEDLRKAAKKAKEAVEDPEEGKELEEARRATKQRARSSER